MRNFRMHSVLTIILVTTPIPGAARAQNRDPARTPVVYSDMSGDLSSITNEADRETLLRHYSPVEALESLVASGGKSPPMFIARAGRDAAFINTGLDRFTSAALRLNVPLTVVNYADGDHAFDGFNDTSQSRAIIAAALRWVQEQTASR